MSSLVLILYASCVVMLVLMVFAHRATGELKASNEAAEQEFQRWLAEWPGAQSESSAANEARHRD
jgi:cell division protein FtsL